VSKLDELIQEYCPEGVEYRSLVSLCKIETGKLNANAAVENGPYLFFTTAKEISRIDKYRWDTEALLIAGNANVGDVKHYEGKFDAYQRTYVLNSFDKSISVRFLYFFVSSALKSYLENRTNSAAMTYIVLSTLQDFKVPIPPLEVQKEIVSILDKFTQLEAELSAELEARRKQYEYYRNLLLNSDVSRSEVKWLTLGDVATIKSGKNKGRKSEAEYPVFGSTGVIGYSDKYVYEGEVLLIARVGAYAGQVNLADGKYDVSDNTLMVKLTDSCSYEYFYHLLVNMDLNQYASGGGQPLVTAGRLKELQIPVPELNEQHRIAGILDKFYKLTSDISIGLPAEITARRQQYEYYRTKLLTFQELPA
jgi:type I restriction enzyme S subunit